MPSETAQRGSERTPPKKPEWKTNEALAVGKGATVQEFVATVGEDRLEIDVAPWGEGHLRVNGVELAHVDNAKDRRQAFRKLNQIAERYAQAQAARFEGKRSHPSSLSSKPSCSRARRVSSSASPMRIRSRGAAPRRSGH
jgi:hypothetical protein